MKLHYLVVLAGLALTSLAHASVVEFSNVDEFTPASTFADGTFSNNLSGYWSDGFFQTIDNYTAFNGYGQQGESISFNSPVTLDSLKLAECTGCFIQPAFTVTANLFDSLGNSLGSQSVTVANNNFQTLNFNVSGVSTVEFDFSSNSSQNPYGDGRSVAWYDVSDVTYNATAVPEPESYALLLGGMALMGLLAKRRKHA